MKTFLLIFAYFILFDIESLINAIDELEVDLRTNCVTYESLEFLMNRNEIVKENVAGRIEILKNIVEKCANFEQIDETNSPNDFEFNQNKVDGVQFSYQSPNLNWNFDTERQFFKEILFYKNLTRFNFQDFAWSRYENFKTEKNAILKWVQTLNNKRLKRIEDILRTKLGAKITINRPGYLYDNIEINDLLETLEMSSKGETLYSYAQLKNIEHEIETIQKCSQLAYLVCGRRRSSETICKHFFASTTKTSNLLFELKIIEPMSEHFGSDVNLYYDLYRLKGEKGSRGRDGGRGEKGRRGRTGLSGEKGERGDKGESGYDGDDGDIGQRGDYIETTLNLTQLSKTQIIAAKGFDLTGVKGRRGDRGEKGSQGYKGKRGQKGNMASTLAPVSKQAFAGPKGDKGASIDSIDDHSAYFWFNDAPSDGISINVNSALWSGTYRPRLYARLRINRLIEHFAQS